MTAEKDVASIYTVQLSSTRCLSLIPGGVIVNTSDPAIKVNVIESVTAEFNDRTSSFNATLCSQ